MALSLLLAGATAFFLVPPGPPEQHIAKRIPVVFWHGFSGEWQPIYESMMARFNASQDKYEVISVSVPGEDLSMKFLLSCSGGATPDCILDWDAVMGMWAEKGLIRPLDEIMTPAEKKEYLRRTYNIIKRHTIYHGKIMAMVDGLDLAAVYYRLDDLKEVGVDENHLPKTLEELVELGKKLDRRDDKGRLLRMGFLPKGFSGYAPSFGGHFNEDNKIVVNTPKNLAAMTFLGEASKRYGFDAVTRFASTLAADTGPNMPLIAGNYSIMFDGEWRIKQVAQYAPKLRYTLAPLPPPKGGKANACMTGPNLLMIPTAAKNPQGAWEFAKFCVGFLHPEEGGRNMGDMGWLPEDDYIANSKSYQEYMNKYPKYKVFVDLMKSPNLEIPPQGPLENFTVDAFTKTEDSVLRGTLTPKQGIAQIEKQLADEQQRRRDLGEDQ